MEYDTFNKLDKSWSRPKIINKLRKGEVPEKIVNDFIKDNKNELEEISELICQENIDVFDHLESLAFCETKLIKYIKSGKQQIQEDYSDDLDIRKNSFNIKGLFLEWSNKLVISMLIFISLVSLVKQA